MRAHSPEQVLFYRRLRELVILFTLFVVPGLLSSGNMTAFDTGVRSLGAPAIRNVAFGLLILYLTDLHGERSLVRGAAGLNVPLAVGIAAALFVLSLVTGLLGDRFDVGSPAVFSGVFPDETVRGWVSTGVLMLTVAWVEELFFRAYMILRLRQLHARRGVAIVIAALLFAVGHGYQGVLALVFAFSAGMILGILWVRRPSLIAFTLGHGAYNIVALAVLGA
ncbi:MAG: type II CAAX endopeptidase family protein [Spirochaeta sp.]|jgi:membrane protease YdiL (CAAX protease family)|nr:type II CAAX endopeptidase family protein [Spirochaeta sp.]